MKKTLIAANWKSNKTKTEAKNWLEEVSLQDIPEHLEVVIFSPFTLLDIISGYIRVNSLPLKLGAQDVSPFSSGAYTGEVSGAQIKEFADYVLIGHSERRSNFNESDEMVTEKTKRAIEKGLTPIVCVSKIEQVTSLPIDPKIILAYEPLGSIGTGNPEDPNVVSNFIKEVKDKFQLDVIYGGSVSGQNVKNYLSLDNVSGVLGGTNSLSPKSFIEIIKNAI